MESTLTYRTCVRIDRARTLISADCVTGVVLYPNALVVQPCGPAITNIVPGVERGLRCQHILWVILGLRGGCEEIAVSAATLTVVQVMVEISVTTL